MSYESALARGKANYEAGKFLDNPETMAYADTLKVVEKPKAKKKEEVKEDAESITG